MKLEIKIMPEKKIKYINYFSWFVGIVFIQAIVLSLIFAFYDNAILALFFILSVFFYLLIANFLSRIQIHKLSEVGD